jgi:hypothetical protein
MLVLALANGVEARELFRKGAVVCGTNAPQVKSLTVGECSFQKTPGGGHYTGSCDGQLVSGGQALPFVVFGEATRIDHVFPDNNKPLTFGYKGISCTVVSSRVKTVQSCRVSNNGLRKQCLVCAITGGKVCFEVRLDLRLRGKAKIAAQ